jgi:hypothetical protein
MSEEQKPKMRNLFIEMPVDVHQKLKDLAYVRGVSMKELIIEWVRTSPEPEIKRPSPSPDPKTAGIDRTETDRDTDTTADRR